MHDINEAYGVFSNSLKRAEYNKQYDFVYGNYRQEKKQEKREEPKREKKTQEKPKRNLNEYFWDGSNPKRYSIYENNFEKFRNRVIEKLKKDEFETTTEFENRKKVLDNGLSNDYLGSQNISMNYDADKYIFSVEINNSLKFKISIPRNIAKDFKNGVKSFLVIFSKDLKILDISTDFRGAYIVGAICNFRESRKQLISLYYF